MTVLAVDTRDPEQFGEFALWVVATIFVVALHLGLGVAYLWLRPEPDQRAEAPAFDVAFMPAENAPAAPPSIDQPDPAPTRLDLPKDPLPPPIPELEPPPPPQVEAMVPPPPIQEVPPPPAPAVVVQPELPPPPPVPDQATIAPVEKPPEVTVPAKPVVVPAPSPKVMHEEKVEKHQAPPKSVAAPGSKPMRVASAPNPGAESEGARVGRESWLNELAARVGRFATYPNGSRDTGTARVSVTVARNGRLVSHRLAGSSGSAALDQAAMAAVERAQPLPAFPASMPEAQFTATVPLHLRPRQ